MSERENLPECETPCACRMPEEETPAFADEEAAFAEPPGAQPPPCCMRTKERSEKEMRDLLNRLRRIEGQVRGIRGMIERDAYCADVLVQVAAATAALNSFTRVLLAEHIKTCVAQDIRAGREEKTDELIDLLRRLMR